MLGRVPRLWYGDGAEDAVTENPDNPPGSDTPSPGTTPAGPGCLGSALGWGGVILTVLYLLNPTGGFIELLPDAIPIFGNLDEGAALGLLVVLLRYLGYGDLVIRLLKALGYRFPVAGLPAPTEEKPVDITVDPSPPPGSEGPAPGSPTGPGAGDEVPPS